MSATPSAGAFLRSQTLRAWIDGLVLAAVVTLTLVWLVQGAGLDVWRHDSLYYLGDYGRKATSEGRWLVWLLYRPMTALPGGVLWLAGYLLFGGFAFRVARTYDQDRRSALLFALLVLQIPSVFGQSLWPAGTFPGPLLLFAAAWVCNRMPLAAFYLLFGVLFFGVSQQYYFFLPVLHLASALAAPEGALRATGRLLALWALGFLAGAACGLAFVYATSGHLGLSIPDWREPHYVTGLATLLANVASRCRFLVGHLRVLVEPPAVGLAVAAMAALGLAGRRRTEILVRLVVFAAVGLAIYAVTVPIGVVIQFRTATPLFFAVLAFAFLGSPNALHRALHPVALLVVFVPFWLTNLGNLQWYRTVTDAYRDELTRVLPQPPQRYRGVIVVYGTARPLQRRVEAETGRRPRYIVPWLSEESGRDLRWRPSALAAGFRRVRFCGPRCRERLAIDPEACVAKNASYCVHGSTPDGYLLLSFVPPDS